MFFWAYAVSGTLHLFLVLLILAFIGLLPSVIAFVRRHHNRYAILVLNILLGWTLIGWAVALVWSLTAVWPKPSPAAYET